MSIDSAGNMFNKSTREDAWAILVIGVEPKRDELGASNIYIVDALISPLTETEAIEEIVRMYLRNGIIMQVGVEKESLSTTEIHVQNALKVYGRNLSIERETLKILRPANRNKIERIMKALEWPLFNSKIFMSKKVPIVYRERLLTELSRFPFWHDDGLDALSYIYDMINEYHFSYYIYENEEKPFEQEKRYRNHYNGTSTLAWMSV